MIKIYVRAEVKKRLVHECLINISEAKQEIEQLNIAYSKYGKEYELYISALSKLGEKRTEEDYAQFCILCDREEIKPLVFFDWLIQYKV